jgi:cytochrome o ubiquinol oxidase subunit II
MRKKSKLIFLFTALTVLVIQLSLLLKDYNIAILNPKGVIANQQKDLLVFTVLLSAIVVVPVFIMVFLFAHKYNEKNTKSKYRPDWDSNKVLETIWWGVPILIILVLSVVTFKSTHDLDPFKPIESSAKPLTIQVVALQWKWLFIYPEQNIATINYIKIPKDVPVEFKVTADAPMNSFWIPQLGGQIYAMSGMSTELNLMANEIGEYSGSSANLSGEGFAGMGFVVSVDSKSQFDNWVAGIIDPKDQKHLTKDEYNELAKKSENNSVAYYHLHDPNIYNDTIMKYMAPAKDMYNESQDHALMLDADYGGHR